jgi:hypothetical protein
MREDENGDSRFDMKTGRKGKGRVNQPSSNTDFQEKNKEH